MTAWSQAGRGGLLSALVARAEGWLVEPSLAAPTRAGEPEAGRHPSLVVIGLEPGCGATVVARALAVELARRDPGGAAAVSAPAAPRTPMVATSASRRLARAIAADARATGRLCLVPDDPAALRDLAERGLAPLVIDVPHGAAPEGPLALAERAVLVASETVEPALASLMAASLRREGAGAPLLVVNRVRDGAEAWVDRGAIVVGESRIAAGLALVGREPFGALSEAAVLLADRCSEP